MKKNIISLLIVNFLISINSSAQKDVYLRELVGQVLKLRLSKTNKAARNEAVICMSKQNKPKITLMDDAKRHKNELGTMNSSKFLMNNIITYVHERQNKKMYSKGDYFHSLENGIPYSAIEKNILNGKTVSYTLSGHVGEQEFVIISFNKNTQFHVRILWQGKEISSVSDKEGKVCINIGVVRRNENITIEITNNNKEGKYESFVILNHNPQK